MQRLHEDDLAGHLLQQGGWEHLNLAAIAPEDAVIALRRGRRHLHKRGDLLHPQRENRETLERIRAEIGSLLFSAQYMQQPIPIGGNLIRRSWFLIVSLALRVRHELPGLDLSGTAEGAMAANNRALRPEAKVNAIAGGRKR